MESYDDFHTLNMKRLGHLEAVRELVLEWVKGEGYHTKEGIIELLENEKYKTRIGGK